MVLEARQDGLMSALYMCWDPKGVAVLPGSLSLEIKGPNPR